MESLPRTFVHRREVAIEPASVLPCQLGDNTFGRARLQPERRLQLAVLEDAVLTFNHFIGVETPRARRLFAEIEEWVASDDTSSPFAFQTICQSLDLDPDYVRGGLRRWRAGARPPGARKPPVRRDVRGTRHRVLLYPAGLRRIA